MNWWQRLMHKHSWRVQGETTSIFFAKCRECGQESIQKKRAR